MDKRQFQTAKEQGRACRRSGGKRSENPYNRSPSLKDQAEAWEIGFTEVDMERRARR